MATIREQYNAIKEKSDQLKIEMGICPSCDDVGYIIVNAGQSDEYKSLCECKINETDLADSYSEEELDEDLNFYKNNENA